MANLNGKSALVTGGSRGIGAAIARRLASDGASVAITYASSKNAADAVVQAIAATGGKGVAIKADAADAEANGGAVRDAAAALGGLDVVVVNAGLGTFSPIDQIDDATFEKTLSVNVRSAFYTAREAAKVLRDNGRIIFIGSVNSDSMPFAGGSVYALTKGAIAAFTRGLARDLAPRGITVNNIQPGPINTDLNPEAGPFAENLKQLMAIKRYGTPDEVAALAAHLAGPDGGFITGAGLKIDGGFDA